MSADTPAVAAAPAKRARRVGPPQSFTRTLTDVKGNTLQFIANIKADGSVNSYVNHRIVDAKGKMQSSSRGATVPYATVDACKEAFNQAVAGAITAGWTESRGAGNGGYKARPDSFDLNSLPKPVRK